jgi:biopolymer transport protein ExbB
MNELLAQGGVVLAAIVAGSMLGWVLIVWKWLALRAETAGGFQWAEQALSVLRRDGPAAAETYCRGRETALARLIHAALVAEEPERRFFEQRLAPVLEGEATALRAHLPTIAAVAGVLPLLGLLGTVLGMVQTFDALYAAGLTEPGRLASGIGQALITTQAGLVVALPILLMHRLLTGRVENHVARARLYVKKIETERCRERVMESEMAG